MKSPYQLLSSAILDLENHPDVQAIMAFAKEVVDRFYNDLRTAAASGKTHTLPFLLMSFDKVSFGDPSDVHELHIEATTTGKVGKFLCFEDEVTSKAALEVFTREESEVRTFMMMTLVSLRQIEDEGPSHMAAVFLENAYDQLKGVLARSCSIREAA
ncbi:hypothetical protein [Rhizobium sp. LCM 4573]|uniref:hypothetical protein n=1 Tax=Rhizobium sp. LCM 4573 TaxID=1848291 RepID=UPI0008D95AD5|nr:hypothetical protein [Rhizobium sp. LCM 4573]OHV82633.1 hypothetical protein LCM4573_16710 [Rhizobium sp. LCM 4573]